MIRKLLSDVFRAYKLHPEFIGLDIEYVNQRGVLGCMLLHIASRKGNHEHMAILLDNGAAIDARGDLYNTPLHEAALCGQAQAVEFLLSRGADATLKNELEQTPLDVAIWGMKAAVCEVLCKRCTG